MPTDLVQDTRDALTECSWELRELVFQAIKPLCVELDADWCSAYLLVEQPPREDTEEQAQRVYSFEYAQAFSARPIRAWVNTPSRGDCELNLEQVIAAIPPFLLIQLILTEFNAGTSPDSGVIELLPPEQEQNIVPGTTVIYYKNGHRGLVLQGDEDWFVVLVADSLHPSGQAYGLRAYSVESLNHEIDGSNEEDARPDQASNFGYLPERFDATGSPLHTLFVPFDPSTDSLQALATSMPNGTDELVLPAPIPLATLFSGKSS